MRNIRYAIGTIVKLTGIAVLVATSIKEISKRYEAEIKLSNAEFKLAVSELDRVFLEAENTRFKKQLEKEEEEA